MRRERRHELQRNELADWLGNVIRQVGPYSNTILVVALLAALVIGGSLWWVRRSAAQAADAWESVHRAWLMGGASDLEGVMAQYPGTDVAHWAAVLAGNTHLSRGCLELFENKATAADQLRKAIELFRMVQEQSENPTLLEQATYGLARAYEAMAGTRELQGEGLQSAIEAYQEVVAKWPDGAYAELARYQLEELNREDVRAFYDRFAMYDPKPAISDIPGLPGGSLSEELKKAFETGPDSLEPPDPIDTKTEATAPEHESAAAAEPEETGSDEPQETGSDEPEETPGQASGESKPRPAKGPVGPDQTPREGPEEPEPAAAQKSTAPDEPPSQDSGARTKPSPQGAAAAEPSSAPEP